MWENVPHLQGFSLCNYKQINTLSIMCRNNHCLRSIIIETRRRRKNITNVECCVPSAHVSHLLHWNEIDRYLLPPDQEAVLVLHLLPVVRLVSWWAGDATPSILDADQPRPGPGRTQPLHDPASPSLHLQRSAQTLLIFYQTTRHVSDIGQCLFYKMISFSLKLGHHKTTEVCPKWWQLVYILSP